MVVMQLWMKEKGDFMYEWNGWENSQILLILTTIPSQKSKIFLLADTYVNMLELWHIHPFPKSNSTEYLTILANDSGCVGNSCEWKLNCF